MAIEVTMPQMGADMTEGTLVRWLKQVGDHVERGDILAEIETDKATVELEAYEAGELLTQAVGEGEIVPVGQVIALIGEANEAVAEVQRMPPAATPARRVVEGTPATAASTTAPAATTAAPGPATSPGGDGATPAGEERLRISPVARRIALEAGVDVRNLQGSGPDGRILRRDVEQAMARQAAPAAATAPAASAPAPARPQPAPAPAPGGTLPLTKMRQAIARRMTQSKQAQPHYYLTLDIDMTEAMAFRKQLNDSATEAQRVSINDLVVKACATALQRHPKFNAEYSEHGLVMHERINIDIGIALDEGLIAPAVLDCGAKSLGRIAEESKDLIERAKNGRLTAEEYSDGTFTITNLGAFGVETLIGIINPPQAAILGVGSVMPRPAVRDGEVVVRQVMKVALSADHRVTDGAEGARFIKEIQALLESPVSLAL
ncbi:MAG: 2-oxo acid dehydrogenase subunit E2 [Dehalococcoidia bacterium]|nr:2-oxo acid dehydrogenase subunit E2 [Dehalococcoidia bacterium]